MNDVQFERYMRTLLARLRVGERQCANIRLELQGHLTDLLRELIDAGCTPQEAIDTIIEDLGDVSQLARAFNQSGEIQRRKQIMRALLTTVGVAASILLLSVFLPFPASGPGPAGTAQATVPIALPVAGAVGPAAVNPGVAALVAGLPYSVQMAANGVPAQINHQGVITVEGTRFNGQGLFRFAIVDSTGTLTRWLSSADTSPADGVPDNAVTLAVADGVYGVLLGDTGLINMASLSPSLFEENGLKLRVWFDDNQGHGLQPLSPEQPLTSCPYAFLANTVTDGAITTSKLAGGAVTNSTVAANANIALAKTELATYTPWTDFTPNLRGNAGSAGSFAYVLPHFRYTQVGKLVYIVATCQITHKGNWAGDVIMDLPVPAASANGDRLLAGYISAYAQNPAASSRGVPSVKNATTLWFIRQSNYFTVQWSDVAINDVISIQGFYEAQ